MAANMIFRQVLRDGLAFAVYEQQAMAVLVNLHFIAGTDPRTMLDLFGCVRIETTRAQRPSKHIEAAS
jgi:hypothetical protein